jgi:formylglycine-generating enzyme required for sulfatase activity
VVAPPDAAVVAPPDATAPSEAAAVPANGDPEGYDGAGPIPLPPGSTSDAWGVEWLPFAGGAFRVGAQRADPSAPGYDVLATDDDARPGLVSLSARFVMRVELTGSVWSVCEAAGACTPRAEVFPEDTPEHPARGLKYAQAEQVCAFLGARVPTGEEWDVLARGGKNHRYQWGNGSYCPVGAPVAKVAREQRQGEMLARCPDVAERGMRILLGADLQFVGQSLLLYTPDDWAASCQRYRALNDAELGTAMLDKARTLLSDAMGSTVLPDCGTPRLERAAIGPRSDPYQALFVSGNVAEWTDDRAGTPPEAGLRAIRGGSYLSETPAAFRVAGRVLIPESAVLQDVGVRCVRGG